MCVSLSLFLWAEITKAANNQTRKKRNIVPYRICLWRCKYLLSLSFFSILALFGSPCNFPSSLFGPLALPNSPMVANNRPTDLSFSLSWSFLFRAENVFRLILPLSRLLLLAGRRSVVDFLLHLPAPCRIGRKLDIGRRRINKSCLFSSTLRISLFFSLSLSIYIHVYTGPRLCRTTQVKPIFPR